MRTARACLAVSWAQAAHLSPCTCVQPSWAGSFGLAAAGTAAMAMAQAAMVMPGSIFIDSSPLNAAQEYAAGGACRSLGPETTGQNLNRLKPGGGKPLRRTDKRAAPA